MQFTRFVVFGMFSSVTPMQELLTLDCLVLLCVVFCLS